MNLYKRDVYKHAVWYKVRVAQGAALAQIAKTLVAN